MHKGCQNPTTLGQAASWRNGVSVYVNFVNGNAYNASQRQAIRTAFANWEAANGATGNCSAVALPFATNYLTLCLLDRYPLPSSTAIERRREYPKKGTALFVEN